LYAGGKRICESNDKTLLIDIKIYSYLKFSNFS